MSDEQLNTTPPDPERSAPNDVSLAPGVSVPRSRLLFTFSRSRGPGGQSVNKLSTAALLRVALDSINGLSDPAAHRLRTIAGRRLTATDELLIHAEETRSQRRNREACIDRLREMVLRAVRVPKQRKRKKPTRGMIERRLRAKREHSERKGRRKRVDPE